MPFTFFFSSRFYSGTWPLHIFVNGDLTRKRLCTDPFAEVDQTAAGGLQQHGGPERGAMETEVTERHVKLHFHFGDGLHFLAETLERRLQLLPQFSFSLKNIEMQPLSIKVCLIASKVTYLVLHFFY